MAKYVLIGALKKKKREIHYKEKELFLTLFI